MMRIRPVKSTDLDKLYALAARSGVGLTTLPKNKEALAERIAVSEQSFAAKIDKPGNEYYLFILEDTENGALVGTCALAAAVGMQQPFYTYTVGRVVHASPSLKIHNTVDTLYLGNDFTGATEICTLFLDPDYRGGANGRLLSRSRFLFLADQAARFDNRIIAEMRGVSDDEGHSPFWESLGRKFFSMEFAEADAMCVNGNQFIAELMPHYPIYISMLTPEAQEVIGKVHPMTEPAYNMLIEEGFRYTGHVDIFDAGPTIESELKNIRSVKKSLRCEWRVVEQDDIAKPESYLLSNSRLQHFRACLGQVNFDDEGNLLITDQLAETLELQSGDKLRVCRLF